VSEVKWKKTEYKSWDDAFRGLVPTLRRQSVRVAAYTQVLFRQACATPFGAGGAYHERICEQYEDLAYKCGLYHQLGKALVPPQYQIEQPDFNDEERALFRKYTADGRLLVANLQERSGHLWGRKNNAAEKPTRNIPWLMIRESCQQHMERWDGSGYPNGLKGDSISSIAQVVGLAHELDRLSAETKSEDAFGEAMAELVQQAGTAWNPALIEVLKQAEPQCKEVFEQYIRYTLAVPKTVPLVEKRTDRPMGLRFKPVTLGAEVVAYEAAPWFRGIGEQSDETSLTDELTEMLERTGMVEDAAQYFLYEAADALVRVNNCKLPLRWVILDMIPSFYSKQNQLDRLEQLFQDQPIEREQLLLTIPEDRILQSDAAAAEVVQHYLQSGINLLLDGVHPDRISQQKLEQFGFRFLRLAPELSGDLAAEHAKKELVQAGFVVLDAPENTPMSEDEMIHECLLRERQAAV
jgi:EAL domain-containing protein (putative c-di-GMP-specific phosphodiesterase class I)